MKINANNTSVVLLVGGEGSRFSSLSEPPKQLSKLNNDYILIHILKHYKNLALIILFFLWVIKKSFRKIF